jgi:putative tryptophan/tyrosine transport system substrate-binding protein
LASIGKSVANRREFISGVAGSVLGAPFAAIAQPSARLPRIGILANYEGPPWDGFRSGLRELGYIEGRTLLVEWRWAQGRVDRYPALASELVQAKVDLIVTSGTPAALAAKETTGSIPIVMAQAAYPERLGLAESLSRPGANITGLSHAAPEVAGKRLQLLKQLAPKTVRIVVLGNPASTIDAIAFRENQEAAAALGLKLQRIDARTPEEHAAAFAAVTESRADAMHVVGNPANFKNAQAIADFSLRSRLPSSYEERAFALDGGLLSYAASYPDLYFRAATYVDKILKGAKPGELPIQRPTKFELVINLKTATALGLTIPRPLLLQADEVIQ